MKYVIGIVGGIASGKSYIANILKEKYNAIIISADEIAHKHLKTQYVLNKLKRRWAKRFDIFNFYDKDFRTAIAKIIFSDKGELKFFEKLMGPLINKEIIKTIKSLEGLIVLDMPLLFEAKMEKWCNSVWYISLEKDQRMINFAQRYPDKSIEDITKDFNARENRQLSTDEKAYRAKQVIFNMFNGYIEQNRPEYQITECLRLENVANILRLCKDCKWCELDIRTNKRLDCSKCLSPNNFDEKITYSLIFGKNEVKRTVRWEYCDTQRDTVLDNICGPNGKWFEPKGE